MIEALLAFGGGFALCVVMTPIVRTVALRGGWLDVPTSRKVKTRAVPRVGGVAILGSTVAPVVVLLITTQARDAGAGLSLDTVLVLIGAVLASTLGLVDDLLQAPARLKLLAQAAIALTVALLGLTIDVIPTPWGTIELGPAAVPVTVVWIVAVMNSMNLLDGLDGLAAGAAVLAAAVLFAVSQGAGEPVLVLMLPALAGALLGFLIYNFYPASIIMGDSGSLLLGFVLGASAIVATQEESGVSGFSPLIVLALPFVDTILAMARRVTRRRPVFAPDREHIHHQLVERGLSQRAAVLVLYAVCGLFAILAAAAAFASGMPAILILAASAASAAALAWVFA